MIDIELMIKLLKKASDCMGRLNGDAIASLNEMVQIKMDIDQLISQIEREENEENK